MGAGKSEATEYLKAKYGGREVAFASPIYDILRYAQRRCGLPIEKDRKFLQLVGTDWGRAIDPFLWIRATLSEKVEGNVYLSDLRFRNELTALASDGWVCVKLVRAVPEGREGTGERHHVSEFDLDNVSDWDFIIENEGSLTDLYRKLDDIVAKLRVE